MLVIKCPNIYIFMSKSSQIKKRENVLNRKSKKCYLDTLVWDFPHNILQKLKSIHFPVSAYTPVNCVILFKFLYSILMNVVQVRNFPSLIIIYFWDAR